MLELSSSGIHVAEYLTSLPPKELLREKLHQAIAFAHKRLENQGKESIKLLEGE
jgi:hypothetical protein